MDCKEFRELLDLYADGELSLEATLSARAHLEECAACGRAERQLALLRRTVKRVVNEREPPPELVRDVGRIARPAWRRLRPHPRAGRQAVNEGAGVKLPFWKKKIAVPAPAFALLVIALLALASRSISTRPAALSPALLPGARKVAPTPPASARVTGLDLTQFDRGERAAIYKVRLANPGGQGQ